MEPKKEHKVANKDRFKIPDNRRIQRVEIIKDKKDRTLDPMDPASYSDIPRYNDHKIIHNITYIHSNTNTLATLYVLFILFTEVNGRTALLVIMKQKLVLIQPLPVPYIK